MRVIGIDPGVKGALVVLDTATGELLAIHDLPTKKQGKGGAASSQMICPLSLIALLQPYAVPGTVAALEVAIVKPPMKLTSARTVGMNYGVLLAILASMQIGVREMAPHDWKKRLGLSDDKAASEALATTLWPRHHAELSKRADRAEAALIARAGCLEMAGGMLTA